MTPMTLKRTLRTAPARIADMLIGATVAALLALPAPATAAVPTTAPTTIAPTAQPAEPVPSDPAVTLTAVPAARGIATAGADLDLVITRRNNTSATLPTADVTVSLAETPVTGRGTLDAWLTPGVHTRLAHNVAPIESAALPTLAGYASQTARVTLSAATITEHTNGPGVYPVSTGYDSGTSAVVSRTAIIVPGSAQPRIAVLLPITAGPQSMGLLDAEALGALTAPTGRLTVALSAATPSTTLAIDPAIPAAIRALGDTAPESARDWLTRLMQSPHPRFALQFGDADPGTQLGAGLPTPLQPESLSAFVDPSAPLVEPTASAEESTLAEATENPEDEPTEPSLLEDLLEIGGPAISPTYWPGSGSIDTDILTRLGAESVPTLIPSSSTHAGTEGSPVPPHAEIDGANLLVYDQPVSAHLSAAADSADPQQQASALVAATAQLALASADTDQPILIALDRAAWQRGALTSALQVATDVPGARPATLAEVLAEPATAVTVVATRTDQTRASTFADLLSTSSGVDAFATVLEDPTLITSRTRAEMLQLFGVEWTQRPQLWGNAVADFRQASSVILNSVGILRPGPVRLFNADSGVQVWVRNDLDYPVRVNLITDPNDLRVTVDQLNEVTAQPHSNERVDIAVRSRVGSGEITMILYLTSPTGVAVGERQSVDVSVRAEWEGVGLLILSILGGGLVILGILRTVIRRRHPKTPEATEHPS